MSRRQRLKEVVPKLGTIYGYFWEYIAPQRRRMAGAMLALVLGVFFRLLEPWPLKIFLDHVIGSKAGAAQAEHGWLSQFAALELLLGVAVAMVVIAAARAMADFVSRVGFFVVGNKVVMKVREQLYEHLLRLPVSYHAKSRTGDLIVRVTSACCVMSPQRPCCRWLPARLFWSACWPSWFGCDGNWRYLPW
jgi:ATP-binding cassette subfamily B protein